jgi:hypothetical protein
MPGPGIQRGDITPAFLIDRFGNTTVNPNAPVVGDASQGKINVPKPQEILDLEKKLGREVEPIYATGQVQHGSGTSQPVEYGPPIGYRYDNGQSQYVNFDTSGQQTSIQDRQNLGTLIRDLAPLALAALGANFLVPMLSGAGAGGLLGAEGTIGALESGQLAALNTGGGLTTGGAGALGMGGGTGLTATLGTDLAAGGLLTAGDIGLAGMGGAAGLTALPSLSPLAGAPLASAGTGLASMGGGTGLTMAAAGGGTVGAGGVTGAPGLPFDGATPSKLPSWVNPNNALLAASALSSIAKANETTPTAAPFTMAPYVPPSGKPFANLGMSPIATPYTPTRIAGQYDPTMTPGGVSPYELIMQQMQAPQNLYANFEAGTNIGGFDPQRFVVSPAAAATALPNNMGGMIDKSRMVGPNPIGPDNGFASIQDGEFVMNRKATAKYGIDLMNAINSGKISKGKLSGLLEA